MIETEEGGETVQAVAMGDSETYTRLERDSFGVERMVTYNSAGECIGIADPVLDEEGRVRFVPRPDIEENREDTEGAVPLGDGFVEDQADSVPGEAISASPTPGKETGAQQVRSGQGASAGDPWWSNPRNTPALVIASIFAGAIFFLGLSLLYRMVVNPTRPDEASSAVRRIPDPQPNAGYEQPTAPGEAPNGSGPESYPPMPQEPTPDPYAGTMPNDMGPTDPAMDPNVPDPMLAPGESEPESKTKPKEPEKKPIDLRGDDDDSGATSAPPPAVSPTGTESKTGSGPDLRGSGE